MGPCEERIKRNCATLRRLIRRRECNNSIMLAPVKETENVTTTVTRVPRTGLCMGLARESRLTHRRVGASNYPDWNCVPVSLAFRTTTKSDVASRASHYARTSASKYNRNNRRKNVKRNPRESRSKLCERSHHSNQPREEAYRRAAVVN